MLPYSGIDNTRYELVTDDTYHTLMSFIQELSMNTPYQQVLHG